MATQVGVGYSDLPDSRMAGSAAVHEAMKQAGIDRPDLVLLFSTGKHDPIALHAAVRAATGSQSRIVGGYAVGVITNDRLSYDGSEVGVAVFQSDSIRFDAFIETGLAGNEQTTGARLARQISGAGLSSANLLLLYDSVNLTSADFHLNRATPLIEGMSQEILDWPPVAGVGMIGDMQLRPTWQWFDDRVEQQAAIALALSGAARLDTAILHGCRPAGRYHTVTKTDGATVLEIDGRPALDVISEMLGPESDLSWDEYSFFVTLGVNKGDKYGPFRPQDYANRLCIGVDKPRNGLVMFETDLRSGMEVQLMRRSVDFGYIPAATRELIDRAESRRPVFAFYIDCAGRAAAYCGMDEEEAAYVQQALPPDIPLLGIYSGVEVAKVGSDVQALDWTGVLCLISE